MEYYVTTPDGEKGPHEEETIRGWIRDGTIPRDTPVRRANEMGSRPASFVFPNEAPELPSTNASSDDFHNPYAPPKILSVPIAPMGEAFVDPGSFGWGLVLGLVCGCFAFIWSFMAESKMGSETKRGVHVGFLIQFVLGLLYRLVSAARAISNVPP